MISVEREEAVLQAIDRGQGDRQIERELGVARKVVARLRRTGRRDRSLPPAERALPIVAPHRCLGCGALIVHEHCLKCRTERLAAANHAPTARPRARDPLAYDLTRGAVRRQRRIFCQKCSCDPQRIMQARAAEPVLCPLSPAEPLRILGDDDCPLAIYRPREAGVSSQSSAASSQPPTGGQEAA